MSKPSTSRNTSRGMVLSRLCSNWNRYETLHVTLWRGLWHVTLLHVYCFFILWLPLSKGMKGGRRISVYTYNYLQKCIGVSEESTNFVLREWTDQCYIKHFFSSLSIDHFQIALSHTLPISLCLCYNDTNYSMSSLTPVDLWSFFKKNARYIV